MNNFELASNPNTPKEVLEKLSNYKDLSVRYCVAENPNTSKECLKNYRMMKIFMFVGV